MNEIEVLDRGYVRLIDWMGDDLSPVNDARVSYDRESEELTDRDIRLLDFLGREGHTSPFRGAILKFECYAPLLVARQWWKYIIGSDFTEIGPRDPFTQWNESSRRYITEEPEFYLVDIDQWRYAPENSKQGSGKTMSEELGNDWTTRLAMTQLQGLSNYERAIEAGIAPEQARLFLPAYGLYVRFRWTASVLGVAHFLNQRLAHDAQAEIQAYAKAVDHLARSTFPYSLDSLVR